MALFDMIDAVRDSGLTSILPIPLWVPACPGWDFCSWPGLGQVTLWFTPLPNCVENALKMLIYSI
ncbi:MAG: hypothetical protein BECKG1743D_GA0114223_102722 [Candidatus Kentron sp. G]|nr:MAG: hypothetical protein BECKG1743D_GA0114223_102722 [Candidatus Kentron sp. G]VFN01835.1 MAG: hypothetical protein BECKG1743E_GA0114224_104482 [Candidatus Kentron sp. G]